MIQAVDHRPQTSDRKDEKGQKLRTEKKQIADREEIPPLSEVKEVNFRLIRV